MGSINKTIIGTAIVAIGIGLVAGYFLFGHKTTNVEGAEKEGAVMTPPASGDKSEIYTCSMHPQIRQPEPGDCPICGMELIPVGEQTSDDPTVLQMTREAAALANIQTTVVGDTKSGTTELIRLSGKVQQDERRAASLVAHVPGRIERLFVTFTGEEVRKGQQLASIYSPQLITAQRELLEARKLQAVNPALLTAARNKLRYWKFSDSTITAIENSGEIRETFPLHAEESGVVTKRYVAVGDYISRGAPLFAVMNLQKVWVIFDAYEEDLKQINQRDKISFTTPAIPNKTFTSRVTFIDPFIDPQTRVAAVRTEVNNPNGLLKPEMLVYGTLTKKSRNNSVLTVPQSAVLWTGLRSVVYVKLPELAVPSFQFREVKLGETIGDSYQVLSGLEAGETVVTHGSFTIDAAAQLNNQASMMNRDVELRGVEAQASPPDFSATTPTTFQEQLFSVVGAYLKLKDALVATNPEQAQELAREVLASLGKVEMQLVEGKAHAFWMDQLRMLEAHGKKIVQSDGVEQQREQFIFLSQSLIRSVEAFGVPTGPLYVQHCPMANNDEGADWLSREAVIRNPYFGDKMLACGLVTDTIGGR